MFQKTVGSGRPKHKYLLIYLLTYTGLGVSRPLHVEPGLFEWLGWYTSGLPKFMSVQELMDCGFRIDPTYKCHWAESKFNPQETTEQYYDRCHYVTKEILSARENEGMYRVVTIIIFI